jgi:hypothetical protein
MADLSNAELSCARVAVRAIEACGGRVSFDEYDREIGKEDASTHRPVYSIWAPLNWIDGWGDQTRFRRNHEKLAVFAAVQAGLVVPVDGGYKIAGALE